MQSQEPEAKAPAESKGLAPNVPQVTADAAAARPRRKKLKWRTRDQLTSQLYNLQLDLNDLRQEIKALQEYEQLLRTHTLNQRETMDDYYVKRTMQYHKVFEHGYNAHSSTSGSFTSADTVEFIQNMMDNEVAVGSFVGFEVILDQWERYTAAFPGFQCTLKQSRIASADEVAVVSSTTEYAFEISETALQVLFPTLQSEHPHIGAKLLGRQFCGAGVTTFTFDPRSHRVVCYDNQVDFLNVFATLLQDSSELCVLFENAAITEQHFLGDTDSYPVLQACDDEEKARYRIAVFSDSADDEEGGQNSPNVSHKLQLEHILAESS
ncbi:hypothetical protein P3T76_003867 [Phytophthora citrophthora]|uniref:Bzip transcription factor n=1 Tax=Phytophthora citrophthora TaxID=4793 RepID=A0AAD9GVF9_9STRA|nr:hypothetical protein P3T76_003867 [Phytophthora citrophthora]